MPKRDKNSRHYVDNKEFLVNITEYRETVLAAKEDKSKYDPEAEEWIGDEEDDYEYEYEYEYEEEEDEMEEA